MTGTAGDEAPPGREKVARLRPAAEWLERAKVEATRREASERPPPPTPFDVLSILALLLVSVVAFLTWLHLDPGGAGCVQTRRYRGANVDHGLGVAFVGGLVGSLLIVFVRRSPRLFIAVLLLAAATFVAALTFVALDSATDRALWQCGPFAEGSYVLHHAHLAFLYAFWGVPLAFLVYAAVKSRPKPRPAP